mgnify:CR=1 FL=1
MPREPSAVARFVVETGRVTTVRRAESLYLEGDRSRSVLSCLTGRVRLVVTGLDGHEVLTRLVGPGDHFGEVSALTGEPRETSAISLSGGLVAHVPGDRFVAELDRRPELADEIRRSIARQLRLALGRLVSRDSETAPQRTAHTLALLAEEASTMAPESVTGAPTRAASVRLDITQHDLAEWAGTSRESVCRTLGLLRRRGVVETGRCHVTVLDRSGLARLRDL